MSVLAWGATLAVGVQNAAAAPGYDVFVGYADTLRANPAALPTPCDTGPGVTNEGRNCSAGGLDSGAVRVVNTTGVTETVNSVTVTVGTATFNLWPHNISLASFGQLVFDETVANNFDTSDIPSSTCTPDGIIPSVTVTVDGTPTTYADSGQVLNTGGVDKANCSGGANESEQWVSIGAPPCSTGATLTLAPNSQTNSVGTSATVVADFSSCGTPLQGASVTFGVVAGPNAGLTGTSTVDATGDASFTYSSVRTGTDTVQAFVHNAAGTIASNSVMAVWTAARTALSTTPPPSVPVGGTMGADTAMLSGGVNPTGSIGFALFGPGDTTCRNPIFFHVDSVAGNGTYSSGPVGTVTTPGTYLWEVAYTGDANNASAVSPCGAEQTIVTPQVLTGRAFGVSLGGLAHVKPTPDTGSVATTMSSTVAPPCVLRLISTHLTAKSLCASVQTSAAFPAGSKAQASTAAVTVSGISTVPTIVIGAVQSTSATSCAGSAGSTTIASLKVGTHVILPSPSPVKPNTTINLGALRIVLNQQIPFTGADSGLTVNAIHITALNNAINLIVASSTSDIGNCP